MFDGGQVYALCERCAAFERAEKIISEAIAFCGDGRYKTEKGRDGLTEDSMGTDDTVRPTGVTDSRELATHKDIASAVRGIERERREAMGVLMRDFDETYYLPNLRDMREACGGIGHEWRFTHLGQLNNPRFSCAVCGATESRDA